MAAVDCAAVTATPPSDLVLAPINGEPRPLSEWLVMFHLLIVAVDPFSERSAWIIDTAGRVLEQYEQADCRIAWLVGGRPSEAELFLGPWASRILTFADPDLTAVRGLGLETLPALVLFALDGTIEGKVEGWDPAAWRDLTEALSAKLRWSRPAIPAPGDPAPFEGASYEPAPAGEPAPESAP